MPIRDGAKGSAIYQRLDQIREDNTYTHAVTLIALTAVKKARFITVSELKAANRVSWSFWF